jgi:hypothetical protein
VKTPLQLYEKTAIFYDAAHLKLEAKQDLNNTTDGQTGVRSDSFQCLYDIFTQVKA